MRRRGLLALLGFWPFAASAQRTIESVLQTTGNRARRLLETRFAQAGVAYPPKRIALLAIKDADRLELWARQGQRWKHVHDYRVLAVSGGSDPKLREGDLQVPEGFYRIAWLNPNSKYHLSMKIDYPNTEDRKHARLEGRDRPGGWVIAWSLMPHID